MALPYEKVAAIYGNQLDLWAATMKMPLYDAAILLCKKLNLDVPSIEHPPAQSQRAPYHGSGAREEELVNALPRKPVEPTDSPEEPVICPMSFFIRSEYFNSSDL